MATITAEEQQRLNVAYKCKPGETFHTGYFACLPSSSVAPPSPVAPPAAPLPGMMPVPGADFLPVTYPLVDDRPWYKKPLVLGAIGAGVLVLGTGGYFVFRR